MMKAVVTFFVYWFFICLPFASLDGLWANHASRQFVIELDGSVSVWVALALYYLLLLAVGYGFWKKRNMIRYLVIIEKTATGFSAYSPDLPGCVSTGENRSKALNNMREAIDFHVEGLRLSGSQVPAPASKAIYCHTPN
jgi:predicted RNase H-like HicB family nuclease